MKSILENQSIDQDQTNQTFDIMSQIYHKYAKPLYFQNLIDNLTVLDYQDLQYWLPQLVYLYTCRNSPAFRGFFSKFILTSPSNFYQVEWLLKAYSYMLEEENHILQLRQDIENIFVNDGPGQQIQPQTNEEILLSCLEKECRNNFIIGQDQTILELIKFSLALKQIPINERKEIMIQFLQSINNLLKRLQRTQTFQYSGLVIPFPQLHNKIVINILEREFTCFDTANRVPYRLVLELIDPREIELLENLCMQQQELNNQFQSQIDSKSIEKQMQKIAYDKLFNYQNIDELKKFATTHFKKISEMGNVSRRYTEERDVFESQHTKTAWGKQWDQIEEEIKSKSKYGHLKSYQIFQVIIKGGDDLRQELLIIQLLKKMNQIFKKAHLSLFLYPYEILVISPSSGMLEFVPNTISLDSLKKTFKGITLKQFYNEQFGINFVQAQKNFADSLAGYSLACYFLQLRDRHNGNILIDHDGHIIHIDFGFCLQLSPGGLQFEKAPFKLNKEYVELLDGMESEMMVYFKYQMVKGFLEIRKNIDELLLLIKYMMIGYTKDQLYCVQNLNLAEFIARTQPKIKNEDLHNYIDFLVDEALNSWSTSIYDYYQYQANGIEY